MTVHEILTKKAIMWFILCVYKDMNFLFWDCLHDFETNAAISVTIYFSPDRTHQKIGGAFEHVVTLVI